MSSINPCNLAISHAVRQRCGAEIILHMLTCKAQIKNSGRVKRYFPIEIDPKHPSFSLFPQLSRAASNMNEAVVSVTRPMTGPQACSKMNRIPQSYAESKSCTLVVVDATPLPTFFEFILNSLISHGFFSRGFRVCSMICSPAFWWRNFRLRCCQNEFECKANVFDWHCGLAAIKLKNPQILSTSSGKVQMACSILSLSNI